MEHIHTIFLNFSRKESAKKVSTANKLYILAIRYAVEIFTVFEKIMRVKYIVTHTEIESERHIQLAHTPKQVGTLFE